MEPHETIEERNRRLHASERQEAREREAREFAAKLAPPPEHFVSAARQIIAAQDEPPREPAPAHTHHADAAAASLARMHATLAVTAPAMPSTTPTPVSTSLARMQAATGMRTN